MNTLITANNNSFQSDQNIRKEFYKFSLNHLQFLLDRYCHTGKEYYWEEAKKERQICEKLSRGN